MMRERKQPEQRRPGLLARTARAIAEACDELFPGYAVRRQALRQLATLRERQHDRVMQAYFPGADETGRLRGDKWMKSRLSPDSALELDLENLREHSRILYRSLGFFTGAIDHRVDNVVGCGLNPRSAIRPVEGLVTKSQADLWNAELDAVYEHWSPLAGRSGRQSFGRLQRLAHRIWKRDGDCLVVFSDVGRARKPIPLQLDVIVPERLETPPRLAGNKRVRLGVERDAGGDVVRYHVRNAHPDDTLDGDLRYTDYGPERTAHIFEELYGDQTRGLPWGFSIQDDGRDFKDFREATIISAEAAACVMLVIATNNPSLLKTGSQNADGEYEMEPGRIMFTDVADQVTQVTPQQPATTFGMFSEWQLLGMAAGLNTPFGWLVKDRRRATYSAGRLEEIDGKVPLECDHQTLDEALIRPTWHRLVEEAVIVGACSIPPTLLADRPELVSRYRLTPNGRPWVDPLKEVTAAKIAKEENLDTVTRILSRRGLQLEDTYETRSRERQLEEELGITPAGSDGADAGGSLAGRDAGQDETETEGTETEEVLA